MSGTRRTVAEPVYVLEINGVPTVAFAARNQAEAMTLRKELWFLDDLKNTRSHGAPLWDGKAPLTVRHAPPDLEARYQRAAEAIIDGSDDLFVCYLVELDR
jgi:hypothetical protein